MGWWNDRNAFINGSGNLSLGNGVDDEAGDASYKYAKDDVWVQLNPLLLTGIPTTNLTEPNVRTDVGQYGRLFTAGGAITPKIPVYIPGYLYRTYVAGANQVAAPKGYKVNYMILGYTIATADATSIAVVFTTEDIQTNSTARSNSSTTPLGAVTYQNPIGTVVSVPPVIQDADPVIVKVVPATPVFITAERDILTAEIQLSLPNTCALKITELSFNLSVALY